MRRKYERSLYEERVNTIKNFRKDCCFGVDVIVGFPGETDEEFLDSYNFISKLDISYLHVFTYSERANTSAPKLGENVPMEKRKERSKMLHILSEKKKRAFYEENIGTERTVLFESEEENGIMFGFTENYIKVKSPFNAELINTFQKVSLREIDRDGIMKVAFID